MKNKTKALSKRWFAGILCLCMILSFAEMFAFAAEEFGKVNSPKEGLHTYIIGSNELEYESLKEAVKKAETGSTIQLTENEIIEKKIRQRQILASKLS